ncbi:TonB-dependent receptor [bacterium]|nr:TonB-dependent receptor [bacterium]
MNRFILLLLVVFVPSVFSQHSVRGKITDQSTRDPLDRVIVYIPDLQKGTMTADDGSFTIEKLPAGRFQMQCSRLGYRTATISISTDSETELAIELMPSPIKADDIIITAPYTAVSEKTTYPVASLNKESIDRGGALTLTESMKQIPGIDQLSTGSGIAQPVIRGLHGNRVLTMINGFRFDNQQWQDEHGLGLSDVGIDKLEIIKGPASLLYGSDAMGGVIHVIDEKPALIGQRESDMGFKFLGNTYGIVTDYGIKQSMDDHYWKLRAGFQSHADYIDGHSKRVPNSRLLGGDLKTEYGWNRPNLIGNLRYDFSYYAFGIVENEEGKKEEEERPFARGAEEAHHGVNYHLLTLQNTFFKGSSKWMIDAGIHLNNRKEIEGEEEKDIGDLDMQLLTYALTVKYERPWSSNSIMTLGAAGTLSSNSNNGKRVIIPDASTQEFSGFAYLKHQWDHFLIEEGVRANAYHLSTDQRGEIDSMGYFSKTSKNYSTINGALGLAYQPAESFTIKTNFSSGYRAPNLAELMSNGLHEGTLHYEVGDSKLKSEQNFEGDLGLIYRSESWSFDVSGFYNRVKDFIYLSPSNDTTAQGYRKYYFLQSDATLKGGEAVVEWSPVSLRRLTLHSAYAVVIAKRSGDYIPLMPADKWTSSALIRFSKWSFLKESFGKVELVKAFRQSREADSENETPGYHLVNLSVGGKVRFIGHDTEVTLGCNNLLSENYYDHLSRIKPGSFNDPAVGFNNPGRNIYFNLRMTLQ